MLKKKNKLKKYIFIGLILAILPFTLIASQRWIVGEIFTTSS